MTKKQEALGISIEELVDFSRGERIAEFVTTENLYRKCYCILPEMGDDIAAALEDTLIRILEAGGTEGDVYQVMGAEIPEEYDDEFISIDRGYCICGQITHFNILDNRNTYRSYIMKWCADHGVFLEDIFEEMDAENIIGLYCRLRNFLQVTNDNAPLSYLEYCKKVV